MELEINVPELKHCRYESEQKNSSFLLHTSITASKRLRRHSQLPCISNTKLKRLQQTPTNAPPIHAIHSNKPTRPDNLQTQKWWCFLWLNENPANHDNHNHNANPRQTPRFASTQKLTSTKKTLSSIGKRRFVWLFAWVNQFCLHMSLLSPMKTTRLHATLKRCNVFPGCKFGRQLKKCTRN